jgi:TRAP-type C4-dicarboxylate transport system substrate-binding protein
MFANLAKTVCVTAYAAAIFGSATVAAFAQAELRVNTALSTDDPMYLGLEAFKAGVEERTNGEVTVKLFSGSALGKDEDVLEQARAGAPVAVLVDGGRLAVFVPELGILGAPYLASNFDEARMVVTSDLFEGWVSDLRETSGHQILAFNWWQGVRHLLTNKPISVPADLEGVRMRTPGAPSWIETVRAMGAVPTPMGWTEVYSAIQQGSIDAAESQHPATMGQNLQEVISHITKTGHINLMTGIVTSADWFDSLTAEQQAILREEALKAGDFASRINEQALDGLEKKFVEMGVTVTEIDTTPFVEATEGVYDILEYTDLRAQIMEIIAAGQ